MGPIHSRASNRLAKAEPELVREQQRQLLGRRKQAEHAARVEAAGDNPWRQPTVRDGLPMARRLRQSRD
jgi:hypothetical protein